MLLLTNAVRRYAWGTTTAIAELLGTEPDGPQAELWIGAHPDSPSLLEDGRGLDEAVRADPLSLLGRSVSAEFDSGLPFLLKFLSASTSLSLQVHPSQGQARAGYAAEEAAGVPRDARTRRYRDPHHKPEMIVALTPLEVLCGLRPVADVLEDLEALDVEHPLWDRLLAVLRSGPDGVALRGAFELLLSGREGVPTLVQAVVAACATSDAGPAATVTELARGYPTDPGVVVSILLHRVSLLPWEALFLPAGNVHAYLSGTGVEVMASSDNVLRAGLTPKHVDVEELVRLVDFTPRPVPRVRPRVDGPVSWYRPDVAEFALAHVELDDSAAHLDAAGPRVLLVLDGELAVRTPTATRTLRRGQAVFLSDADGPITVRGTGSAVLAAVPPVDGEVAEGQAETAASSA